MRELSSLMTDEDKHVVYESSCVMLYYNDSKAMNNIQNLSKLKGELGFAAESTLLYYNKGELSFWYLK